jgi:excisionase family DNA binding protein
MVGNKWVGTNSEGQVAEKKAMTAIESLAIQPNAYYTVEEAAQLLRVSKQTMLRLLQSGRARGVKIGRQWRILGAALLDLSAHEEETEASLVHDWLAASTPSLREILDNEEDAVYDQL